MAIGEILVGVALRVSGVSSGVRGFEALDIASRRAAIGIGLAKREISSLDAAIARNALTNESIALRQQRLMEGTARQAARTRAMIAGAFALGGAVAIGAAVNQAAQFQLAMTSVNNTLGATSDQMQKLNTMALHISGVQAQSATTIAQEMAVAARAGLGSYGRIHALFPLLTQFADVQQFMARAAGQSMSPQDAVGVGVQFAHLFQAYTPGKMAPMLEWITKLQTVSNESLQRALTQGRYFIPMGNVLGLSMEQQFELLASMAQTGFLRGRGGSSLGRTFLGAINAATLTGHSQSKQAAALRDLGILSASGRNTVVTLDGLLNWQKFMQILSSDASGMKPARYIGDLKAGFGVVSSQFMSVFTSKAVQDQLGFIKAQFDRLGNKPIEDFFKNLINNFLPQFQRFVTNFTNLGINVFLPTLPALTQAFKSMADVLGWMGDEVGERPWLAWTAAGTAVTAVSGATVLATANLWALNRAILAMGTSAGGASITGGGVMLSWLSRLGLLLGAGGPIAATLGLMYGIMREAHTVSKHPEQNRREQWAMYGANRGMMPPDTRLPFGASSMDIFGGLHWNRSGRAIMPNGGQLFEEDRFRRALRDSHLWEPVVNRLTGGSSTTVTQTQRESTDKTVDAIHAQTSAIVDALSRVGVTINVPGQPPQHQKLFGPHSPTPAVGGGHGASPIHSPRLGGNHKP